MGGVQKTKHLSQERFLMSEQETKTEVKEKKKDYRGLDIPNKSYYIGSDSWKIDDSCKAPPRYDKLKEIVERFEETADKLEKKEVDEKEAFKLNHQTNKEILEMTLEDFNYDIVLQKVGYIALDYCAIGIAEVFLKYGGMTEFELLLDKNKQEKIRLERYLSQMKDAENTQKNTK